MSMSAKRRTDGGDTLQNKKQKTSVATTQHQRAGASLGWKFLRSRKGKLEDNAFELYTKNFEVRHTLAHIINAVCQLGGESTGLFSHKSDQDLRLTKNSRAVPAYFDVQGTGGRIQMLAVLRWRHHQVLVRNLRNHDFTLSHQYNQLLAALNETYSSGNIMMQVQQVTTFATDSTISNLSLDTTFRTVLFHEVHMIGSINDNSSGNNGDWRSHYENSSDCGRRLLVCFVVSFLCVGGENNHTEVVQLLVDAGAQ